MNTSEVRISHNHKHLCLSVRRGLGIQAVAARHKTAFEFDCRDGDCGICIFRVVEGMENLSKPELKEADFLKAMRADPEERLGCQTRILGNVSLEIESFGP